MILQVSSNSHSGVAFGIADSLFVLTVDAGDYVTVSNAAKIHLSGRKGTDKVYRHHSGFIGGLKEVPITRMQERRPEEIVRKAVSRMLPKNTFRDRRLERLRIYPGEAPEVDQSNTTKVYGTS